MVSKVHATGLQAAVVIAVFVVMKNTNNLNPTKMTKDIFKSKDAVFENTWAVIDMQNVYKNLGYKINWRIFREYLKENLNVSVAVIFMGFIKENMPLYISLKKAGFVLHFRKVRKLNDGTIDGGNCDADLAAFTRDCKTEFSKVIHIADDGDYCAMIKSLFRQDKLKLIISSHSISATSEFIKEAVPRNLITSIHSLRNQIEYKKIAA